MHNTHTSPGTVTCKLKPARHFYFWAPLKHASTHMIHTLILCVDGHWSSINSWFIVVRVSNGLVFASVTMSVHTHAHTNTRGRTEIHIIEIARQTGLTQEQSSHHQSDDTPDCEQDYDSVLWLEPSELKCLITLTTDTFSRSYSQHPLSLTITLCLCPFHRNLAHNLNIGCCPCLCIS